MGISKMEVMFIILYGYGHIGHIANPIISVVLSIVLQYPPVFSISIVDSRYYMYECITHWVTFHISKIFLWMSVGPTYMAV